MESRVINKVFSEHKNNLSIYATKDDAAIRMNDLKPDFRTDFFRDIDRIIHTLAYNRYSDKTQVFSLKQNDHISKRMIHVQMVSKIARTIGRALSLNEDLIEAIALGHDLGHTPLGHAGEYILNELSLLHGEGLFNHNVQSVRVLKDIENKGLGLNISLQVLDGIMCHNGELELREYKPVKKTLESFLDEYNNSYKNKEANKHLVPMTLEGCVVRISDIVGYLGKDIEDAIKMGVLDRGNIPDYIVSELGNDNRSIINNFVTDIIENSIGKPYIKMSDSKFNLLKQLKLYNYENIYFPSNDSNQLKYYKDMFYYLFDKYLYILENNKTDEDIFIYYLSNMSDEYKKNNNRRIVIDYIAGMTDSYLVDRYNYYRGKV